MNAFGRLLVLGTLCASPAAAQLTLGAGLGGGVGSRGKNVSATHGTAFVEFKLPVLPGARVDAIVLDAPDGVGALALAANVVFSAPIPVIKPYLIAGWGSYGLGKGTSRGGWNAGVGVRMSLGIGVFGEYRRHQRIARDLFTVGLTF
jgi:hypothetical protein